MKQLSLFIIIIVLLSLSVNSEEVSKKETITKPLKGLPVGPIFWEGWVKFFHYKSEPVGAPTSFFLNNEFYSQKILKQDMKRKDEKGFINIPTEFHFYGTLMINNFNILRSRKLVSANAITENVDTLYVDNILPLIQGKKKGSSIQDLGNFAEGFCAQILTNKPLVPNIEFNSAIDQGDKENWIICMESDKDKKAFLKQIEGIKIAKQERQEQFKKENPGLQSKVTADSFINQLKGTALFEKRNDHKGSDGYFVLLQDWSQCTLKCGGGKSYQHWMCIPPKAGGRPCQGKEIRYKNCNMQPCPGHKFTSGEAMVSGGVVQHLNTVLKPIIKSLPYSNRRQKTMKCVIKEADVFYKKSQEENGKIKLVKMPSRIVLNNNSISAFSGEAYDKSVFTFKIQDTEIGINKSDACCFDLMSNHQQTQICGGFGQSCYGFVNEWLKDFNTFKFQCYNDMKKSNWEKRTTKSALDKAMEDAASGSAGSKDRENMINKKLHEQELDNITKKIGKTQDMAMKVIKKEMDIEKMIQQEVQLKAMQEAKDLLAKKKQEERKKKYLEQAMRERESENDRKRDLKQAELEIQKIKAETAKEVENKRLSLKKKIDDIKKKALRRKRLIEQDINVIRSQVAQDLISANKNGDLLKCKNGYGNPEKINYYCNTNVVDDINKNIECKSPLNFCYVCCETEFGNMNIEQRDRCYDVCDALAKQELDRGDFKWQH